MARLTDASYVYNLSKSVQKRSKHQTGFPSRVSLWLRIIVDLFATPPKKTGESAPWIAQQNAKTGEPWSCSFWL